eukprot:contig_1579_g241
MGPLVVPGHSHTQPALPQHVRHPASHPLRLLRQLVVLTLHTHTFHTAGSLTLFHHAEPGARCHQVLRREAAAGQVHFPGWPDRQGCELGGGRAHSYVPEHVRIGIPQAAEWLRQEGRLLRSTPVLLYIPSTLSPPLSSTAAGVVWNLFRRCVRLRGLLLARRWKFRAGAEVGLCEGDPCGDRQCLCLCQSSATRVVVFSPLTLRSSLERGSERSGGCCTASAHAALPALAQLRNRLLYYPSL